MESIAQLGKACLNVGTGGGARLPWDSLGNAGGEGLDWLCPAGCALPVLISVCVT